MYAGVGQIQRIDLSCGARLLQVVNQFVRSIVNGEPYLLPRCIVRRNIGGNGNLDIEFEFGIFGSCIPVDCFFKVQVTSPTVDSSKGGFIGSTQRFIHRTCNFVVFLSARGKIGLSFRERGNIFLNLDQGGQMAVNDHGSYGLNLKIPVIRFTAGLFHRVFMTFGKDIDRAGGLVYRHLAGCNVRGLVPAGRFTHRNGIDYLSVAKNVHCDRASYTVVQIVLPVFGNAHLRNVRCDRFLSRESSVVRLRIRFTRIDIRNIRGRIRKERIRSVVILYQVFFDVCIETIISHFSVIQICDEVKGILARCALERDRVGNVILEDAVTEIPYYRAVHKMGFRGVGPLCSEAAVAVAVTAACAIILIRTLVDGEHADIDVRCGSDLAGGTVGHGDVADTGHLNVRKDLGKGCIQFHRISGRIVVVCRGSDSAVQILHISRTITGTICKYRIESGSSYLCCKRLRIINRMFITTGNCCSYRDILMCSLITTITVYSIRTIVVIIHWVIISLCVAERRRTVREEDDKCKIIVTKTNIIRCFERRLPVCTATIVKCIYGSLKCRRTCRRHS